MEVNQVKAGFSASKLQQIDRHLNENYMNPGKIAGCQVMVSRHGVPAYFESFGEMDRERAKLVTDDTIFRIYSMTKPITSIALMMLFEEGRFQLNDPVYRFFALLAKSTGMGARSWRRDGNAYTGVSNDHATSAVPYRGLNLWGLATGRFPPC
jgi:CubicO group peptidase (beta-lactamase class C family)